MDAVMNRITVFMAGRRNTDPANPDFSVRTQQDIVDARASSTEAYRSLLAWVADVSLRRWHRHHEHHARQRHRAHP